MILTRTARLSIGLHASGVWLMSRHDQERFRCPTYAPSPGPCSVDEVTKSFCVRPQQPSAREDEPGPPIRGSDE
jgi:hypothetical protein